MMKLPQVITSGDAFQILQNAHTRSLKYLSQIADEDSELVQCFECLNNKRFCAEVRAQGTFILLEVSTGAVEISGEHWNNALHGITHSNYSQFSTPYDHNELLNTSLIWLIIHELSHFHLGHFKFADHFGVAQRASMKLNPILSLPSEIRPLSPLCFEMQADHEATDILLGAYPTNGWQELRQRVLAISGMMILIEGEDTKNGADGRTHPKAATRIFQLLGHLAEMPLIKAQVHQDTSLIPSEEELQSFACEVTVPCFFDAIQLAQAADATSIAYDLGSLENFFKDLEIAKLGDPSQYADFKTHGAQEWAKLWPCNEALKPILGGHFKT
ncbi:hypothetical protein [Pseudophaeobacter sp.]|uniref:hypothetical protein n=1 Tax=Pseudophaeobacter sp. TaxID=1971739 RepID=UPI003298E384